MLKPFLKLMRLDKPIGIYLLMWPTLWSLWLAAHGLPSIKNLVIFILGVVVMRSAGCVINDFADRNFDKHVTRTATRPITTGEISEKGALILFFILCLTALILVLFTNKLTILISIFALLFATIYPFTKRYTHWPQLILGIAFAFSVPMAYAAQANTITLITWLIMITTVLWTISYDTQYAMVDLPDDLKLNIKSTAILFGKHVRLITAIFQFCVLALLFYIGYLIKLNTYYYLSLCVAGISFCYQQYLLSTNQSGNYFKAFLNNHWVGLIIFVGIFLGL